MNRKRKILSTKSSVRICKVKRSYTLSPDGILAEVFCDGSVHYVSGRRHPGFAIAHMIGPRGERPNEFKLLPWCEARRETLEAQMRMDAYLRSDERQELLRALPPVEIKRLPVSDFGNERFEVRIQGERPPKELVTRLTTGSEQFRVSDRESGFADGSGYQSTAGLEESAESTQVAPEDSEAAIEDLISALSASVQEEDPVALRRMAEDIHRSRVARV